MKFLRKFAIMGLIAILFMGMATSLSKQISSPKPLLKVGDKFPDIFLEGTLTAAEQKYFGIPERESFVLEDIQAEIIIVEFFNKYCPHCQQFAPILNELYNEIEKSLSFRSRVKMLGVGMGNNSIQMQIYQEEKQIPFPLVPDVEFEIHDALGRPKAPFTVIFKKTKDRKGIVSATYLGMDVTTEELLNATKKLLQPEVFVLLDAEEKKAAVHTKTPTTNFTEEKFISLVEEYLKVNGFHILKFEPISIGNNLIYKAQLSFKNIHKILFIEEIYRNTVCDVCHDTHFWYSFDINGKLTHFVPISLPKSHNKEWDENDVQKFRNRLLGHSVLSSFEFNPNVDAVTSATITSSLIFDTINETKNLFKRLNEQKIIKN